LAEYTEIKRIHVSAEGNRANKLSFQMMFKYPKTESFQYLGPTKVNAGYGSIATLFTEIADLKCTRAIVVTDEGVRKAGLLDKATAAMGDYCVAVYDQVHQDSSFATVDEVVAAAKQAGADIIVSVGGGSVMDTAKATAVVLREGGQAIDNISIMRLTRAPIPHIAIPTTAGTGSEVTNIAVIKNQACNRKVYILENLVFPQVAILDPEFVMSMPPGLTASTGMDAMTHAIEAISSVRSNPVCDAQALHAIRLIKQNLPRCVKDGNDMKARSLMQIAATLAGWSFTIAQVGLAHAMAHTVGALFNIPHGAACGIILPHVMRFNQEHCLDKMVLVAEALGINTHGLTDSEAATRAADHVQKLLGEIGHPQRLRDVGMTEEAIFVCAEHTLADPACIFNARPVTDQGMVAEVFEQAY